MKKKLRSALMDVTVFTVATIIVGTGCFHLGAMSVPKPDTPSFITIAKGVAEQNEYDIDKFNCANFSQVLVKNLSEKGYEAKVVTGWHGKNYCKVSDELLMAVPLSSMQENKCMTAHAWVEVVIPIDAVTGQIIYGGYQNGGLVRNNTNSTAISTTTNNV